MIPASRTKRIALREIDADGTPLRRRFFCPEDERVVPASQIVRGFDFDTGRYVTVTDRELESLEPVKSREIDLQLFVDRAEISPVFFERSYYLVPNGDSNKAYRLLARVLEKTQRAGIATFVMRDRGYLIAILGAGGILRGQTLRFLKEIRPITEIRLPKRGKSDRRLSAKFARAIEAMSKDELAPRELSDEFNDRVAELIEHKRKRGSDVITPRRVVAPDPDADDSDGEPETDLLETIRRSLNGHHRDNSHATRRGRPSSARKNTSAAARTKPESTKFQAKSRSKSQSSPSAHGSHKTARSKRRD